MEQNQFKIICLVCGEENEISVSIGYYSREYGEHGKITCKCGNELIITE